MAQQPPETPVFHYPNAQKDVFIYTITSASITGAFEPVWYVNTKWDQFPTPEIMQVITDRAIKYIIVHNDTMTADEQAAFKQRLAVPTVAGKRKLDQSIGTSDVYKVQ